MAESYSTHFETGDTARKYETGEYAPGSYANLLWQIEQDQLRAIVAEMKLNQPHIEALDFASGTGRITALLENLVDAVTGIEISQSMCDIATKKVQRARILCADILAAGAPVEGKYDLITAFRFFLNADPALRLPALKSLAERLKDRQSLLVFNNHGNLWSHKLLMWPVYKVRRLGKGRRVTGNYLTTGAMLSLMAEAGLRLQRTFPSGFYSAKILPVVGYDKAIRWERRASKSPLLGRFCVNQLYVATLA
ncbi:MAG TPA: class I SAM-dependent methyltransferase [Tepidisphaeraceae bacterium]|nr:class I SAM-dependent methyltransferase [Tepidisphaeraceae bacterium]